MTHHRNRHEDLITRLVATQLLIQREGANLEVDLYVCFSSYSGVVHIQVCRDGSDEPARKAAVDYLARTLSLGEPEDDGRGTYHVPRNPLWNVYTPLEVTEAVASS